MNTRQHQTSLAKELVAAGFEPADLTSLGMALTVKPTPHLLLLISETPMSLERIAHLLGLPPPMNKIEKNSFSTWNIAISLLQSHLKKT